MAIRSVFSVVRLDTSPVSTEEEQLLAELLKLDPDECGLHIQRIGICWEDFAQHIDDLVDVRLRRFLAGAQHTTDIRHLIVVDSHLPKEHRSAILEALRFLGLRVIGVRYDTDGRFIDAYPLIEVEIKETPPIPVAVA